MRQVLLLIRSKTRAQLAKIAYKQGDHQKQRIKMEIGKNPRQSTKKGPLAPIATMALTMFHRLVLCISRAVFTFIYGKKGPAMPPIKDLTLLESATSLAAKIRTKRVKSVNVCQSFINRIKEVNPMLNCVVDNCFEEALKDAAAADELIQSGQFTEEELAAKKPFLGVPISTKDCIRVKGLLHTAGIWQRRNIRGEKDSDAMRLMREAGAIPFALTNVPECCMWWETVNCIHGRTKNAYDTNRIVGGSSGGEGCLLSAAGSPFGLGSDIGGSIRMPAFFNGVFGHKPSKFIVSNVGQYPIPESEEQRSFLSLGPMSRFATDLKPMLKILADSNAAKLNLDEKVDVSKVKIYYQYDCGGHPLVSPVDEDIKNAMANVVKHFEGISKSNVERVKFEKLKQSSAIWLANMKSANAHGFDAELMNLEGRINPWLEMGKWIFGMSNHTFAGLMTAIVERKGIKYGTPKYFHLVEKKAQLFQEFTDLLGTDGVLLYPTHPTVAPYHNEPIVRAMNFSYTAIINTLGMPSCACPLGLGREGLPLGIQVVAGVNQDRLCLAIACELERVFGGWVPPEIKA